MPSITKHEMNRLLKIEEKYNQLRDVQFTAAFANELANALATLMANTAKKNWPHEFHVCYKHVSQRMPTAAQIYEKYLPKE